jgi:hypothetical protein
MIFILSGISENMGCLSTSGGDGGADIRGNVIDHVLIPINGWHIIMYHASGGVIRHT